MECTSYKTLISEGSGEYVEKRSKFIAFAYPVTGEEEARQQIDTLRRSYHDARHVCWAYVVGTKDRIERSNDDGEPSSTAGKPILGQIISRDLTNCLVAVVRYFGGVKLGTGGLIVAYRTAAHEALESAVIEERELETTFRLTFAFDLINPVMMMLRNSQATTTLSDSNTEGYIWEVKILDRLLDSFREQADALYQLSYEEINYDD